MKNEIRVKLLNGTLDENNFDELKKTIEAIKPCFLQEVVHTSYITPKDEIVSIGDEVLLLKGNRIYKGVIKMIFIDPDLGKSINYIINTKQGAFYIYENHPINKFCKLSNEDEQTRKHLREIIDIALKIKQAEADALLESLECIDSFNK